MANSVNLDEVAHHEPNHQDLRCLQFQLFSSLVLKDLIEMDTNLNYIGQNLIDLAL